MPSKRTPDGEFRDIAHPINSSMRQQIQEMIMEVYNRDEENTNITLVEEDSFQIA